MNIPTFMIKPYQPCKSKIKLHNKPQNKVNINNGKSLKKEDRKNSLTSRLRILKYTQLLKNNDIELTIHICSVSYPGSDIRLCLICFVECCFFRYFHVELCA